MKKCWEVFWRFLFLGCVSFGGPAAHIGYFHRTFVTKLKWVNEGSYAQLLSLSQMLPGPGSSQLGFALGVHRAGIAGGVAAFFGFTLPSFLLMYWLAVSTNFTQLTWWLETLMHGLKLCAVVVVLDAVISMFNNFCRTNRLKFVAALSAVLLIMFPWFYIQILVIFMAAVFSMLKANSSPAPVYSTRSLSRLDWRAMGLFILLFLLSLTLNQYHPIAELFATFYKNGSLVFGGGHVVLPLLQTSIGDALTERQFLFGYAAAQGVPGPMFTMATFMGAQWLTSAPLLGAILATIGIFLPGFLLILALKQSWQALLERPKVVAATAGINAAVVGLLAAAFYQPVVTSTIQNYLDLTLATLGFICIRWFKLPILAVITLLQSASFTRAWLG